MGMVNAPVIVTLATVEPVMVPNNELPTRATMAGPALSLLPTHRPSPMMKRVPPKALNSPPKNMNKNR